MDCLDLFAGTGAFGFEAASRGVAHVTMVESDRTAFAQLQATSDKLRAQSIVTLIQGDAISAASRLSFQDKKFDVIFLDPPFETSIWDELLPLCSGLLKDRGVVYTESFEFLSDDFLAKLGKNGTQWNIIRQDRAGQVCYQLLLFSYLDSIEA
jgi:16S rRNA (guanine(966)-N(2))-methyltransferase RsmD